MYKRQLENGSPSGVDGIRTALEAAEGNGAVPDEVDLEVSYVGAPEYRINVQAPNYKTAESQLEESARRAVAAIKEEGGSGEFHRERRTDDE
ncbi:translation initiation factor IF-2 subunit alpha [Natronococcus jeotgali DSM 18795]|uniref:Translation initiation factor IF-2 subunit alpha n=1 Tax=Natronococcus jeotgali DSM 18795 TaxID=1227498 RepID=L9WNU3_9EURY|nr:translation initiation factor IF-2 subunit alpha [Natronococcus jeotgali DSM 18795]